MKSSPNPSIKRILINDYLGFSAWFWPVILWVIYLISVFIGRSETNPFFTALALAATVVGPVLLVLRLLTFRRLFAEGSEAPGKISDVYFMRDRGKVIFNYIYKGEEYRGTNVLHRSAETRALRAGQNITILVDPRNPKRGFVKELYVQET